MRKIWSLAILGCIFAWAIALFATPPGGTLNGVVLNARGVPVKSAQVFWQAADGTSPHVLHTDAAGRFHVSPLRDGLYDIRAEAAGAWSEWEHNVIVRKGSEITVTLRLLRDTPPSASAGHRLRGTWREWPVPVEDALPDDAAVDPQGRVWVTLMNVNELARLDPASGEWKLFAALTQNAGPYGVVSDPNGNIWFTENSVDKIGRVDASTGAIAEFAVPGVGDPHTPVIGPDGALWFTAEKANSITRMDTQNDQFRSYLAPTPQAAPYGIAAGPDGALWFGESGTNKLGRIDPATGVIAEFSAPEASARPRRLATVGGAIYFSDFAGGRLGRFDVKSKKFQFWPSPGGTDSQPDGIAADATGMVWYAEEGANQLMRFDPRMGLLQSFALLSANSHVRNMARDSRGRIWMALSGANKVAVIE